MGSSGPSHAGLFHLCTVLSCLGFLQNQSPETYSQEYGGFIHFPFYFYFIFCLYLILFFKKPSFEFEGELFFNKYLEVFLQ